MSPARYGLTALALFATATANADSLRCSGELISAGDSMQKLLTACGDPLARDGSNWLYEPPGAAPVVVTVGQGAIMFIRDRDESDAFTAHPMGSRP